MSTTEFDWSERDGVLCNTDGVITPTAEIHERMWSELSAPFGFTADDYLRYVDGRPGDGGVRTILASRESILPMEDS